MAEEELPDKEEKEEQPKPLRWYWPVLFPLNGTGLGMIGMFVGCRVLLWIGIFASMYIPLAGFALMLIFAIVSFLLRAYAYWYACLCVQMAAEGEIKAPDVLQHDEGGFLDMIKQMLWVLGALAFCFFPAMLYFRYYKKTDELFWNILAAGWFFMPMTLLSAALHDTVGGLNPFLIVISIFRVLPRYLLLVLIVSIPFGLSAVVTFYSKRVGILFALPAQAISLYLAFVGAAILGRFYYANESRLDWF
jgi:hypothetical protein